MVRAYTALPPAVAATVPRRSVLRDSWIRHQPPDPSDHSSAPSSPSSTPPMTPRMPQSLKLGELRQKWDTPRPASVVLSTYNPPGGEDTTEELQGITGKVSKAKAFFESVPLQQAQPEKRPDLELPPRDSTTQTIVSYKVKNPLRNSPKPKPRRLRNTISNIPKWDDGDDDSDKSTQGQKVVNDTPDATSAADLDSDNVNPKPSSVEITLIKPTFVRRRYGTVAGIVTDRSDIEDVLRCKIVKEIELYARERERENNAQQEEQSRLPTANTASDSNRDNDDSDGGVVITKVVKAGLVENPTESYGASDGVGAIHRARRVVVTESGPQDAIQTPQGDRQVGEKQATSMITARSSSGTGVSRDRDSAWNTRIASSPQSPIPSCLCDHVTSDKTASPVDTVVSSSLELDKGSECQGDNKASASEGHVPPPSSSSSEAMIVLTEGGDGQVQAAAAVAPRVVAACIKSYHDIPEELFNTLQESSVDPHSPTSSPTPPPPPPSSPPIDKNVFFISSSSSLPPTPAPRSDWKTMREGRKALLLLTGEGSDTEEGSEVDLGGVASTSDYHTSDGRGSSLSGASDDHHHRHDNAHVGRANTQGPSHHQKDDSGFYQDTSNSGIHEDYQHHDFRDVEEESEFECYSNPDVEASTVLIKNNFRGFCSSLLGTPAMPSSAHKYVVPPSSRPPPPPKFRESRSPSPPRSEQRPTSSASLEEELRAAGIYFRRPGSPPRLPSRNRALSPPPPRPPSSLKNDRANSIGDAEAVAAALHVLDASLAGLSDSSGESSPARSHASTVVETRQSQQHQQSSPDATAVDTTTLLTSSFPPPQHQYSEVSVSDSARVYISDLNDSDNSSAVDLNYESGLSSTCSAEHSPNVVQSHYHRHGEEELGLKGEGVEGFGRTPLSSVSSSSSSTVGRTVEEDGEGGPYEASHHHPKEAPTSVLENFNLIEEMYVDTRPMPKTTVSMRAYYPGVHYDSPSGASPKSSLKPPPPPPPLRSSSRHPERGTSLDSNQTLPPDSDSGHESGATSPCGTLILDDSQTPPPSPPTNNHILKSHTPSPMHPSPLSHSRTSSLHSCRGPAVLEGEVGVAVVGDPTHTHSGVGGMALDPRPPTHFVVVAIDFGTTYSGYAFSFIRDPDSIHMMKKWEGGDPGVQNQKTPTIVLLTPQEEFHSLGFIARDTYHDLDPKEAKKWLYFDKFKMALHADETLSRDTLLEAANGRKVPALKIFSYALQYFKDHALKELSDQAGVEVLEEDVRWVITVPAIWSHPAKQFMRTAAYQAGMGSNSRPEQLLIALEPEAAAIYCRRLRRHQLLPERSPELRPQRHSILKEPASSSDSTISIPALPELDREELVSLPYRSVETVADWLKGDTVYAVVDCGGGTVDITVHQMTDKSTGHLKELHKASGGPHGSTGVDGEFQRLLETIFGADFMQTFRQQRPAAYVDLMIAFESRKRNASPYRSNPLNIALPFSFIDLFRKFKGKDVEWAMKKHQNLGVKWSAQGMLRVEQETMRQLFMPTLNSITQAIEAVLSAPEVGHLQYMFLVGGFAESELLQKHIRDTFGHRVNVIIPQGMGLAILRGAVQFGLDPGVVTVRRSRLTYGVGVLNRYQRGLHPPDKRVVAAGSEWCADVLDRFVVVDESIAIGDVVIRPYTPATPGQSTVILHLYATQRHDAKFVTEEGVNRVGTLHLELGAPQDSAGSTKSGRREITVHMKFGDTEVKASAVDHLTGQVVRANIDFLTL